VCAVIPCLSRTCLFSTRMVSCSNIVQDVKQAASFIGYVLIYWFLKSNPFTHGWRFDRKSLYRASHENSAKFQDVVYLFSLKEESYVNVGQNHNRLVLVT
jgi:hypothetical protein